MALPDQGHHVHSDGYRSDKPMDVSPERRAQAVLDDIENQVDPDYYTGLRVAYDTEVHVEVTDRRGVDPVRDIAHEYGCDVQADMRMGYPVDVEIRAE